MQGCLVAGFSLWEPLSGASEPVGSRALGKRGSVDYLCALIRAKAVPLDMGREGRRRSCCLHFLCDVSLPGW